MTTLYIVLTNIVILTVAYKLQRNCSYTGIGHKLKRFHFVGLGLTSLAKMLLDSVLITGANRGIGLEFVKQLLRLAKPPKYIFAVCRSPENAQV